MSTYVHLGWRMKRRIIPEDDIDPTKAMDLHTIYAAREENAIAVGE